LGFMFSHMTPREEGCGQRVRSVGGSLCSAVGPTATRLEPVLPAVCDQFPRYRLHRLTDVAINSLVRPSPQVVRAVCPAVSDGKIYANSSAVLFGRFTATDEWQISARPQKRINDIHDTTFFLPTLDIVVVVVD